jgi:hypothetical protein
VVVVYVVIYNLASSYSGPFMYVREDEMKYSDIINEVKRRMGIRIYHTCWVAEVLRAHGLTKRIAWNRGQGMGAPPCPPQTFKAIEDVLRQNGEIK